MIASIIIPTYNDSARITLCLKSLNHQQLKPGDSFEVVVVDDGSDDGTEEAIQALQPQLNYSLNYKYIERSEHSSRAQARNAGMAEAPGDVIVLMDGDQLASRHFVSEHLRIHKWCREAVVIGTRYFLNREASEQLKPDPEFELHAGDYLESRRDGRLDVADRLSENFGGIETAWHLCYSCNLSFSKSLLAETGGFEEAFQGWGLEDCEFGYRLAKAGARFVFTKDAPVYHLYHEAEFDVKRFEGWNMNLKKFIQLHPALEVRLQEHLAEFFDPGRREQGWLDYYLNFEHAVRALKGRWGYPFKYRVFTISNDTGREMMAAIETCLESRHAVVFDEADDRSWDVELAGMAAKRALLYYRKPSEERKRAILAKLGELTGTLTEIGS